VNAKYSSYEKRGDRFQFEKLAKQRDPHAVLVAHLSKNPNAWIGDVTSDDSVYKEWKKVVTSLNYVFTEDVKKLDPDFDSNFTVKRGEHPPLLKAMLRGEVHRETVILLNGILKFAPHWNAKIEDAVVWPQVYFNLKKYSSFLEVDLYKYRDALRGALDIH
jgi:hypothetical protein